MQSIPYEFTDKSISPWGGLRLIEEYFKVSGFRSHLRSLPLHIPGSGAGYMHAEIIESFIISVILGARRCSESAILRVDEVVKEIFGWDRGMPDQSTLSRFFRKYSREKSSQLFIGLLNWWFKKFKDKKLTIDIDSTVIDRYGKQEGVGKNYKSLNSHHPIIAFAAELKMVVHSMMREGNAVANSGLSGFLDELLKILPKERIGLIRADSGFYGNPTLSKLEEEGFKYIIAAKMNAGLVEKILIQTKWRKLKNGIEYCSFEYRGQGWKDYRYFVVMRKNTDKLPQSTGKTLFPDHDQYLKYRYSAYVTNSDLSDELVWELYKHRAEAENQIKELKYDYALNGFSFKKFEATEFAFKWITMAYNLMSAFRNQVINNRVTPTLSTLKYQCIAIGSYLVKRGRRRILKLAVPKQKQEYISSLFKNLIEILDHPDYSTA